MRTCSEEKQAASLSGWVALPCWLGLMALVAWPLVVAFQQGSVRGLALSLNLLVLCAVLSLAKGFGVLQPNIAAVFTFFGRYAGTRREEGFYWVNPLFVRRAISLRVNNLNTATLKVNDRAGNPIEVAAVVVWRVADTARAVFDVSDGSTYINLQSESAVRSVVGARWYDGDDHGNWSLRADMEAVAELLAKTIQEHAALAGLEVIEARITHLAYAPEIAGAMLRRQQAAAVVAARKQIVDGAVSMVRLAIDQLESGKVVQLSDNDRVRLVTNLMTVLVSDSDTQPVLSVGRD